MTIVDHALYAGLWLSFGLGHSWLAGTRVKARFHRWLGARYRIAYNLIALVHIGLVMGVGRLIAGQAARALPLPGAAVWAMDALALGGAVLLVAALRGYDLGRFSGLAQWRHVGADFVEDERLRSDGPHAYMRHPLYVGAMLLLWGLVRNELQLATALWASLYFIIGAIFEERRLIAIHGDAYRAYRARVPAFLPWRGQVRL